MRKLNTDIQDVLKELNADQAQVFKAALVHQTFANAIRKIYGDKTAIFVLEHVQAVYVQNDTAVLKKAYADSPEIFLRVYTDDSVVRSDLDARQESIKLKMMFEGVRFDKLKSYQSKFDMRKRKPYEELLNQLKDAQCALREKQAESCLHMTSEEIDRCAALAEDERMVEAIKRAMEAQASFGV